MASYKLSNDAKADLIRIHQYGAHQFGEKQADKYYFAFFDLFEIIAKQPFTFQAIDHIQPGYRRCVCGVDSIYYRVYGDIVEIMSITGRQDIDEVPFLRGIRAYEQITFHSSRRTFAGFCVRHGCTLDQIQLFLEWTDIRTLRRYLSTFARGNTPDDLPNF